MLAARLHFMVHSARLTFLLLLIAVAQSCLAQVSVLTFHNDSARTGANLAETRLGTANVNSSQFGKIFTQPVDADVYTQPLYVPNVTIPGKGLHNVVYLATNNNSVYAFDAESNQGANAQPLWHVNFNDPAAGITPVPATDVTTRHNIRSPGPIGIMGTPVIDVNTGTLYLVARTKENGSYFQRLHALDITTGAEKFGGPVRIQAAVVGTAGDGVGGIVSFNPKTQNQRPGLALANGNVYIGWASHEDIWPYHGWLIAYNATTLAQVGAFCTTPDGSMGGIWQSGQPPTIDATGALYLMTGNGSFNGTRNFGQSAVKLPPSLSSVQDYFTPDNWASLNSADLDLGSSGPLLIPGTPYIVGGGKEGRLYVLNTTNLGHLVTGNTQVVQTFQVTTGGNIHGSVVYWDGPGLPSAYVWGEQDYLKAFAFTGAGFNTTPASQSPFRAPSGMPGGMLSVSANGATGGIVWASLPFSLDGADAIVAGVLRAFDASDLSHELWNSRMVPGRDDVGNFAKYVPPTIANGRVYLATFSNKLNVYGLLSDVPPPSGGTLTGSGIASTSPVDLTAAGTADWAHWPGYDHKASGGAQILNYALIGNVATPYSGDLRTVSWSDGTPTASGSSNAGLYIGGIGSGFIITAPADTTSRTLKLYVGGYSSGGMLVAHLSDGSAVDFIDSSFSSTGQYDVVYTLTYSAAAANSTISVQWTQLSGAGNVTLQGAALSGAAAPPPPTGVSASDGTSPTSVVVNWNAVNGASTYTVYRSTTPGVQGSALGTVATTTYTDSTVTPGTTYYYGVTATAGGATSGLSAQDSGFASVSGSGGALAGSVVASAASVNLTTVGTADWAHWPGYDHKASGGGQISNFTAVGSTPSSYGNDLRPISWTDGTPTASASTTAGLYNAGTGNGFRITAPADTTQRTLQIYIGGWASGGRLLAHLSDASAADYVDTTLTGTGQYDGVYTLTYNAASAGQTISVQWTQASGSGNVTLQGAALSSVSAPPAPTNVAASNGTSATIVSVTWSGVTGATSYTVYRSTTAGVQGTALSTVTTTSYNDTSATPGTTYYYAVTATGPGGTSPLSAQDSGYAAAPPAAPGNVAASDGTYAKSVSVTWSAVAGPISYTVYRSTSAGVQGSSIGTTANTSLVDSTVAPGTTYYYGVTASGVGGTSALSVQDTGYAAPSGGSGSLTGAVVASTASVNLTATGTADWARWPGYIHKASGATQISNYTVIGTSSGSYTNDPRLISWSDGTPTLSGSATAGVYVAGINKGFSITAPADAATRTLRVYTGGWSSGGKLVATLSDGSAPQYVDSSLSSGGQYDAVYTLTYSAGSANQTLTVQWTQASGAGNVSLQAAALTGTPPAAPTGVAASDGTSASSVSVTWNAVAQATSYTVYRSNASGVQGSALATVTTTSYNDNTVTPGTTYYYGVTATSPGGTSALSVQNTGFAAAPPAAPTGVSASDGTSFASVSVTWNAVSGANTYTVWRSTTADVQGSALTTVATTTYNDTTATPGTTYFYGVTATGTGGTSALSAQDSGHAAVAGTAALNGAVLASSAGVDLTSVGTSDWAAWPGYNHKAAGGGQISNFAPLGAAAGSYTNDPRTVSWSDGTPTASGSNTLGVYVGGIGNGFRITVPADTSQRTLRVYVGGWNSGGKLVASLSDGSAAQYVNSSLAASGQYNGVYTITFSAASANQTLSVAWTQLSGSGNVTLQGAALSIGSLTGLVAASTATVDLASAGTLDWAHWPPYDHKSGGSGAIANYTTLGGTAFPYTNDPRTLTWSGGTPTASGSSTWGVYVVGVNGGFRLTVPADTRVRTLTLYIGGWASRGRLWARVSGLAADYIDTSLVNLDGQYDGVYTLTFNAASSGQQLTIDWVGATATGNVTLQGAALH